MPERLRLSRRKGARLPEGAVSVARPSRWGNPYRVCGASVWIHASEHDDECRRTNEDAVKAYRHAVLFPLFGDPKVPTPDEIRRELAGKDLACWCAISQVPCHADFLLLVAAGEVGFDA